jgi:hypothetical protein
MSRSHVDRAVDDLARRQHGTFSRRQVAESGGSHRVIERRLASGAWIQLCPGVYALPSHPPSWHRQLKAAELSRPGAVVSGRAAVALHGLADMRPGRPEITVAPGSSGRCPIATVHRSGFVEPVEEQGILCNSVRQSLFDVAGRVSRRYLARLVDDGLRQNLVTTRDLSERCIHLAPTRLPGLPAMRELLITRGEDFVPPCSELEALLYGVLDRLDEPYERQARFPWTPDGPSRVDALIPRWRLIVEGDGRAWHVRFDDFMRDRERDRAALAHGYRTVRYTFWDLRDSPEAVLTYLRRVGPQGLDC